MHMDLGIIPRYRGSGAKGLKNNSRKSWTDEATGGVVAAHKANARITPWVFDAQKGRQDVRLQHADV